MRERKSLMAIDHPEWLFGALCSVSDPMSYAEFEDMLVKVSGSRIEKGSKSIEMYLYTLVGLKLLDSRENDVGAVYEMSPLGKTLCEAREKDTKDYRKQLASILLRNDRTGPFFRKFLRTIEARVKERDPISVTEFKKLEDSFPNETPRTLYSLGREARMITEHNGLLGLPSTDDREPDLKVFKGEVEKAIRAIQRRHRAGVQLRPIYVEISKVRDIVLAVLGIGENSRFDEMFVRLLDSPEGTNIHVYGAPPQWFPEKLRGQQFEEAIFRYHGKTYVFMSIS